MKGSIRFNNDIIAEVDVDPSAASGSRLTSCKNLIDGQELGGGGGSSDFSTAEVTYNVTNNPGIRIECVDIVGDELNYGMPMVANSYIDNIVLYKNSQYIYMTYGNHDEIDPASINISVTGNIEPDEDGYAVFNVRGNGTINIEFLI